MADVAAPASLAAAISRVASLRRCPVCGTVLPPAGETPVCAGCGAVHVCPAHTQWPPRLKWLLAALAVHRRMHAWLEEEAVWRVLLTAAVAPPSAHPTHGLALRRLAADDAYALALTLLDAWVAAGCPSERAPLGALLAGQRALRGEVQAVVRRALAAGGAPDPRPPVPTDA